MCDKVVVIRNLRGHLKEMVEALPCKNTDNPVSFMTCHCVTCEAQHCLAYTSGFEKGEKNESIRE